MCSVTHFIVTVLLFVVLTPGVLLRLPRKGSLLMAAVVHGIIFAILSYLIYTGIRNMSEGFQEGAAESKIPPIPSASHLVTGDLMSKTDFLNYRDKLKTYINDFSSKINDNSVTVTDADYIRFIAELKYSHEKISDFVEKIVKNKKLKGQKFGSSISTIIRSLSGKSTMTQYKIIISNDLNKPDSNIKQWIGEEKTSILKNLSKTPDGAILDNNDI
jgi:hypothetical protein